MKYVGHHNHDWFKKGQQLKQLYTKHYLPGAEDGIWVLSGLVSAGMPPMVDCVLALAVAVWILRWAGHPASPWSESQQHWSVIMCYIIVIRNL